jgi:hypothetical protein
MTDDEHKRMVVEMIEARAKLVAREGEVAEALEARHGPHVKEAYARICDMQHVMTQLMLAICAFIPSGLDNALADRLIKLNTDMSLFIIATTASIRYSGDFAGAKAATNELFELTSRSMKELIDLTKRELIDFKLKRRGE